MSLIVNDDNYEEVVKNKVVVLDLWAEWCGPCRTYTPIVDEFDDENPDITVGKVNVDENREISAKHGIRSIPTTVIFQNGQLVTKVSGVIPKTKLIELTNPLK